MNGFFSKDWRGRFGTEAGSKVLNGLAEGRRSRAIQTFFHGNSTAFTLVGANLR